MWMCNYPSCEGHDVLFDMCRMGYLPTTEYRPLEEESHDIEEVA